MGPRREPGAAPAASSTRTWLRSFGNLALGEGITGVARLWALIVTARALGPAYFGFLNVGLAVGGYLVVAHAGLDVVGTRDTSSRPGGVRSLAACIVGLQLTIGVVVLVVTVVVTLLVPVEDLMRNLILLFSLSLLTVAFDVRWIFVGLEKTAPVAAAAAISSVLYLGGVVVLVHRPVDVLWVPVVHVGSEVVLAGVLILLSRHQIGAWRPRLDRATRATWRPLFRESLPIAAMKAARGLNLAFDIILIGLLRSPSEVGEYGAARRLALVALIFLGLYANAFLPLIARSVQAGPERARKVLGLALRRTAVVIVPAAVVGTIGAPLFLRYLVGEEYTGAASVLRVLIWSLVVVCFAALYGQVMLAYHQQRRLMVIDVVAALASVALCLLLVPVVGVVGAAVAALAARVVMLVWTMAAAQPYLTGSRPAPPAEGGEGEAGLPLPGGTEVGHME